MTLGKILARRRLNVLGLNSGTSADGLDLALVSIDASKGRRTIRFLRGARTKYPATLRDAILRLADSKSCDIDILTAKILEARRRGGTKTTEESTAGDIMIPIDEYTTLTEEHTIQEASASIKASFYP